ncbi:MAG: tol-pal system protein YbgF [Desulfomonile tiedjei]|nr:tol-pal system protein YbgF [Desulfomonile tiedjei]
MTTPHDLRDPAVQAPSRFRGGVLWAAGLSLAVVVSVSGCLSRTAAPGLPYVQPAYSDANPNPNPDPASLQLSRRMQEMEVELQRLRDFLERVQAEVAAGGGDREAVANLNDRIAFIERQLGIDSAGAGRQAGPTGPPPNPRPQLAGPPLDPRVQSAARAGVPVAAPPSAPAVDQQAPVEIVDNQPSTEERQYREAYSLFRRGSPQQAVPLFEDFLRKYPKSPLAADAVYWVGEARFAEGRFDEAVLNFDKVIKEFPGSKKELNALLKQGQAFEKMGDSRSAKIIFQKLVHDHPHTVQARLAASRLKALPGE